MLSADDLRRDASELRHALALHRLTDKLCGPGQRLPGFGPLPALPGWDRPAALAGLCQHLPAGWVILADDIADSEQPVLSGTLRGEPVVLKLWFAEIDVACWKALLARAVDAAGDPTRSP